MKNYILSLTLIISSFHLEAISAEPLEPLFKENTSIGLLSVYRPDIDEVQRTVSLAKEIFLEAFSTTYRGYHQKSGSTESIENWLKLKEGQTLESWLGNVFDDEYKECETGDKKYIYFCDSDGNLIGWLSHGRMSEVGDIYLSQCAFKKHSRQKEVASKLLTKALEKNNIKKIFPGVKELKCITRKINQIATHLFIKAGFVVDETIDPSIYGDSYDDRYVGYRFILDE